MIASWYRKTLIAALENVSVAGGSMVHMATPSECQGEPTHERRHPTIKVWRLTALEVKLRPDKKCQAGKVASWIVAREPKGSMSIRHAVNNKHAGLLIRIWTAATQNDKPVFVQGHQTMKETTCFEFGKFHVRLFSCWR